jgi:hypothetical protein
VAVGAGFYALIRCREINPRNRMGRLYLYTTLLSVLTGFGIFQHGGFGKPHALGLLTLLVLGVAALAARTRVFGRASAYVETVSYSATVFFHMIPGVAESTTRLPPGSPLFDSPEAPGVQAITAVFLLVFLIGSTLQVISLRRRRASPGIAAKHA